MRKAGFFVPHGPAFRVSHLDEVVCQNFCALGTTLETDLSKCRKVMHDRRLVICSLIGKLRYDFAAGLGSLIGFERERLLWAAGIRTHMLVCVGASLIMIVSAFGFSDIMGQRRRNRPKPRGGATSVRHWLLGRGFDPTEKLSGAWAHHCGKHLDRRWHWPRSWWWSLFCRRRVDLDHPDHPCWGKTGRRVPAKA